VYGILKKSFIGIENRKRGIKARENGLYLLRIQRRNKKKRIKQK